ncbi:type VI secretion system lipoprotein TssJ [Aureimonas pseudogalii]|uniref:Type VI secretion system protein VasD n=1 Tax=Aureimonas pseudogalii TaxID=1744844 RepID=A0A7W6MM48_9HYPH|nr:type VI secretion system lipoprotein TssJ [Aureimonas pseudogalii]MBB4000424.1 type VI secretion system protein VasD [Aureimonas pseudogalii]
MRDVTFSRRSFFALGLILPVAGCSLLKKDPVPAKEIEIKKPADGAKIDFLATASPLVNPGRDGVPSPISVRLYVLSSPDVFTEANFFELWEKDEATLGATLLGKKELFLTPSDVQRISAPLAPDALAVGVTVGFEEFQKAKWRAIIPLQGEKTLKIRAKIDSESVTLGPQDE